MIDERILINNIIQYYDMVLRQDITCDEKLAKHDMLSDIIAEIHNQDKIDNAWVPYTEDSIPEDGIYLVTCSDDNFPIKMMRMKNVDGIKLWFDSHGIADYIIYAWMPLPCPYKYEKRD